VEVYRYRLQFEDYLFYATTERGKVFETGWFIHNYALTYALGLAVSEYRQSSQKPLYREQLSPVNQAGLYFTPATVLPMTRYRINQFNTMGETFYLGREKSSGYPSWGYAKLFRPRRQGGVIENQGKEMSQDNATGYLICRDSLSQGVNYLRDYYKNEQLNLFPIQYLRLGKFTAKVKMSLTLAQSVTIVQQARSLTGLLNWADLPSKPQRFDLIASALPTRLIEAAYFTQACALIKAEFSQEPTRVYLPTDMAYFGEP
jgi:CRISPR-associated protein Csc1